MISNNYNYNSYNYLKLFIMNNSLYKQYNMIKVILNYLFENGNNSICLSITKIIYQAKKNPEYEDIFNE